LSVRGPQLSGMGSADHTEFLSPQIYTLTTGLTLSYCATAYLVALLLYICTSFFLNVYVN